jgi:NAD(P)H-hydrate epimerase
MITYSPVTEDILLDADTCRGLDQRYIEERLGDSLSLMERAGAGASRWILERWGRNGYALILCGKGNNGGDGLVVARYLLEAGWQVHVHVCLATEGADKNRLMKQGLPKGSLSMDAEANFKRLPLATPGLHLTLGAWDPEEIPNHDMPYTLIVDALLGTGFRGTVQEPLRSLLTQLATMPAPLIALDVPSGLDATTGIADPLTPVCTATLTFGALKRGLYFEEGPDRAGEVAFIELGFPESWRRGASYLLRPERLRQDPPKRRYKYDGCRVWIIGGSTGMVGAPMMAARAAWSMDLGDVRVMYPAACTGAFETHLPYLVHHPIGAKHQTHFSVFDIEQALEALKDDGCVVVLGPGMGKTPEVLAFCRNLMASYRGRLVVDADALQAFALTDADLFRSYQQAPIITPHPGELRYFAHITPDLTENLTKNQALRPDHKEQALSLAREEKAKRLANTFHSVVVAKGYPTISAEPYGRHFITGYDTRVFNKVGYGDVLAGLIGAYLALGANSIEAALAGQLESERRYNWARNYSNQSVQSDHNGVLSDAVHSDARVVGFKNWDDQAPTNPWPLSLLPGYFQGR